MRPKSYDFGYMFCQIEPKHTHLLDDRPECLFRLGDHAVDVAHCTDPQKMTKTRGVLLPATCACVVTARDETGCQMPNLRLTDGQARLISVCFEQ